MLATIYGIKEKVCLWCGKTAAPSQGRCQSPLMNRTVFNYNYSSCLAPAPNGLLFVLLTFPLITRVLPPLLSRYLVATSLRTWIRLAVCNVFDWMYFKDFTDFACLLWLLWLMVEKLTLNYLVSAIWTFLQSACQLHAPLNLTHLWRVVWQNYTF